MTEVWKPIAGFPEYAVSSAGRALAARYGVSPGTICLIRTGKTWRHVSPAQEQTI